MLSCRSARQVHLRRMRFTSIGYRGMHNILKPNGIMSTFTIRMKFLMQTDRMKEIVETLLVYQHQSVEITPATGKNHAATCISFQKTVP